MKRVSHRLYSAVVVSTMMSGPVLAHEDLTFVSWTGAYMRSQMLGIVRPYEAETGKIVNVEHYAGGIDEIRDQVESANVVWDVVDMTEADVVRACEAGLLERLDTVSFPDGSDGTTFREDFTQGAVSACGIGGIRWSTSFAYDARVFGDNGPTTIADFFDTKAFPGPRAVRKDPSVLVEWALLADGVAPSDIHATLETEEGLDRAFAMLDRIRPGVIWWANEHEPERLLEGGVVPISAAWTVTAIEASKGEGSNMTVVTDGAVTEMYLYAIPAASPRKAEALDFIRYASGTMALARQAGFLPLEPTRKSAIAAVPAEVRANFVTGDGKEDGLSLASDAKWWSENYDRISVRFEEWADQSARKGASGGIR